MSRNFGAAYWGNYKPGDLNDNWGGYQRREQAENPNKVDRFGEQQEQPDFIQEMKAEFPYGMP